ncbi:hypothetical protein HKX48_008205 [Thoreauomyces humboldtii]|nr:hypothetical protein HKX48_008205 [Thoreauomyces humboldtii]
MHFRSAALALLAAGLTAVAAAPVGIIITREVTLYDGAVIPMSDLDAATTTDVLGKADIHTVTAAVHKEPSPCIQ